MQLAPLCCSIPFWCKSISALQSNHDVALESLLVHKVGVIEVVLHTRYPYLALKYDIRDNACAQHAL